MNLWRYQAASRGSQKRRPANRRMMITIITMVPARLIRLLFCCCDRCLCLTAKQAAIDHVALDGSDCSLPRRLLSVGLPHWLPDGRPTCDC